jgi:uncharacterized protein YodC (DUF2158 family)
MAKRDFETGDVVRLKSGGPRMTVVGHVQLSDIMLCKWFEGDKVHTDSFPSKALEGAAEEREAQGQSSAAGRSS